ncbi:MAG: tetratricopeptide repeat protein [Pseudomonadota bacterium]
MVQGVCEPSMDTLDGLGATAGCHALPSAAQASWRAAVQGFLAHDRRTGDRLGAVLAEAPGFALGHAARGLFLMLLGRHELRAAAAAALTEAQAALGADCLGCPRRAAAYAEALAAFVAGRPRAASARLSAWLEETPADALAFKLDHAIRFVLGDRRGMLAMAGRLVASGREADGGEDPWLGYRLGCLAFALEETGHYAAAVRAGRDGLARVADDAWGLHAVAHVFDMTGRPREGIGWLTRRAAAWAHCNNFGAHVWWHLALFHLDRGAWDTVLALYDTRIRAERTDDYRDIANGASMLMRLEIEGVEVGARWDELADLAERHVEPGCVVFADLHYHLALEAAGRRGAADAMLSRLAADAACREHDMHEVAAIAGQPAAEGLTAFRAGHYERAFDRLRAVRGRLHEVGGSHAQRDVFSRLMIEAGIRAGRYAEAETELACRAARRGAEDGFTARRREAIGRARAALAGIAAA